MPSKGWKKPTCTVPKLPPGEYAKLCAEMAERERIMGITEPQLLAPFNPGGAGKKKTG